MGFDKIFDIISVGASWWTPEKVKARARTKLEKLRDEERSIILNTKSDAKTNARLGVIRRDIKRLSRYLEEN